MEYKDQKYTYLGGLIHGISTLATGMKTSIKVYFRKKVTEQYPENRKELKIYHFLFFGTPLAVGRNADGAAGLFPEEDDRAVSREPRHAENVRPVPWYTGNAPQ